MNFCKMKVKYILTISERIVNLNFQFSFSVNDKWTSIPFASQRDSSDASIKMHREQHAICIEGENLIYFRHNFSPRFFTPSTLSTGVARLTFNRATLANLQNRPIAIATISPLSRHSEFLAHVCGRQLRAWYNYDYPSIAYRCFWPQAHLYVENFYRAREISPLLIPPLLNSCKNDK